MSAFAGAADALENYNQVTHAARLREVIACVKPVGRMSQHVGTTPARRVVARAPFPSPGTGRKPPLNEE